MKILETDRLILRNWLLGDANDYFEYSKNPNVCALSGLKPLEKKVEAMDILNTNIKENESWAIVFKETMKVIGTFGLRKDTKRKINAKKIGYVLSEDYWGMGLAAEAAQRVLQHAFEELKLDLVSVFHLPFNKQSKRVIEKCGFKYEGTLRHSYETYDGNVYDEVCYSILKKEYFSES